MTTTLEELAADLDATCRITGDFVLRSGLTTDQYFDKYRFEGDPLLLRRVAEAMVPLLPHDTEVLGGLELGGVPIATMISSLTGIPAVFVRKEAKRYGTRRLAEGSDVTGRVVTLVEDIITTGGAVGNAAMALRDLGARVHTVVCAINRSEPSANHLLDVGVTTRALLTKADLDRSATARMPTHHATDGPGVTDSKGPRRT